MWKGKDEEEKERERELVLNIEFRRYACEYFIPIQVS